MTARDRSAPEATRGDHDQLVPVATLLPGYSPRLDGQRVEHIQMLAETEDALPPILVHRRTLRVIDGMHRLHAARLRGEAVIRVKFFDGSDDEAFIMAVRANISHGLPLTRADREVAAERILVANPGLSDRSIAAITGLAGPTIARIRRRAEVDEHDHGMRTGQDGRVRPLNSADARRAASRVIAERPGASLREVAEVAGISPATVRDVRERMRRGEDPVPPGRRAGRGGRTSSPRRDSQRSIAPEPTGGDPQDRDLAALLHSLGQDPSLRFTESGRALLRELFVRASGPKVCAELMDGMPRHATYLVAAVARACAREWHDFAADLSSRAQDTA